MKRAFTLIELLVVIAIIAILAAILFPVFAQAKNAAKKSASISNMKQIGLASMMYVGDTDDVTMPLYWFNANDLHIPSTQGFYYWPMLIMPYAKSEAIFLCPNDKADDPDLKDSKGRGRFDPNNELHFYIVGANPSYGFNYRYLNTQIMTPDPNGTNPTPWYFVGTSSSAMNSSSTVMFAEATMKDKKKPQGGTITNPIGYSRIEPPSRWTPIATAADELIGTSYGQIWPRFDREMTIVAWLDGHVKTISRKKFKVVSTDTAVLDSYFNGQGQ